MYRKSRSFILAVCFFADKKQPIMDKAEEMSLLQYAMTVTETYTQNEMEVILCVIFIFG